MRRSRCSRRPQFTRLLLVLFLAGAAASASAQTNAEYRKWLDRQAESLLQTARDQEDRSSVGSEHASRVRDELELQKEIQQREKRYSYAEPILSPDGKPIAAMVDTEYMTLEELNSRIRAAMRGMKPLEHPDAAERLRLSEDRVLAIANELIRDWVINTMLALQGRGLGYKVTEAEIDAALEQLQNSQDGRVETVAESPATMIGIRESEFRGEVRDSLIIEKYINDLVDARFKDEDYQRVYRINPASFRIPDRVRAFHVFHPMPAKRDADSVREAQKNAERLRKELRRASKEDMAKMAKASMGQGWSAGDMGWVTSDAQTLQPVLMQALLSTPVNETSPVVQSRDGFHAVRILERENGSAPGLEHSRPQIRNYFFAKTKYATYESLKSLYDIRYNTGGLKHFREVSAEELSRRNKEKLKRPDQEDGITITELRREIENRKDEGEPEVEAGTPGESAPAPTRSAASEPGTPAVDLSILQ